MSDSAGLPPMEPNAGLADAMGAPADMPVGKVVEREPPEPTSQRSALVERWQSRVRRAIAHWDKPFKRMSADQDFAAGIQWPDQTMWQDEDRYVANIVLRHIQQRTATLYARNPRMAARRRRRLATQIWDGSPQTLAMAQQAMMMNPMDPNAMAVIQDAMQAKATSDMLDKLGKTLEILFDHQLDEQNFPFKSMMKATVRRACVTGIGYVKLGFQRAMQLRPEVERRISDISERLATIERLSADIADNEVQRDSAEAEQLRLALQALAEEPQIIVREGLTFDFPDSTSIIPDPKVKVLRDFVGADWVAEQYILSVEEVQAIYGVDVGKSHHAYERNGTHQNRDGFPAEWRSGADGDEAGRAQSLCVVWEIYNRPDGLVYTVCDGFPDFLVDPAAPDVKLDRFWPWFVYALNETYHRDNPFPVSDVRLLRDMQLELNRARQGLREHRHANRPKTITSAGTLTDGDKAKLESHPAHALIELTGLQPGQDVKTVLQPWSGPGIDMNLYETASAMEDIMRAVGVQEANLGGTSGATATETSVAEGSRLASVDSSMADMDEMLSQLARAGGQILMLNVSADTVRKICGPGAVWPEATAEEVAEEIYLEVEAGSAGRPNQAREVQNMQTMAPILMQIPGISPEWLAKQLLTRMDERLDIEDAFTAGLPSISAMNAASGKGPAGPAGPGGEEDPKAQGPQGANNQAQLPGQGGQGPRPAPPRDTTAGATGEPLLN